MDNRESAGNMRTACSAGSIKTACSAGNIRETGNTGHAENTRNAVSTGAICGIGDTEDAVNKGKAGNTGNTDRIQQYIRFVQEAENLKSTFRTAWTAKGHQESTAEHSWRLSIMAGVFLEEYPGLDREKVYRMCLIHDLGELYEGDISAALRPDEEEKRAVEERAAGKIFSLLPQDIGEKWMETWREYEENSTPEAHLVKALDKAETILQHNQGRNPAGFDYDFNLEYGRTLFAGDPVLQELRRGLDEQTRVRMEAGEAQ